MGKGAPQLDGSLTAGDGQYAVVVARWNEAITGKLRAGAVETLRAHGARDDQIEVFHVPGSFELPMLADKLAGTGRYAAVICLGVVIEGETMHHEYIDHAVAHGIMHAARRWGIPIMFGVLTCRNEEQARQRAGGSAGHKGVEAAQAAIEMVNVYRSLESLPDETRGVRPRLIDQE
jgi:6,7-dimethyl-8-ribityllumazine synthase